MKKLFFSAIFVMAFSSVSMGNTITDEEVLTNNDELLVTDPNCMQYAADKCEAYELQWGCMTSSQYNFAFWRHYNNCLDKKIVPAEAF